MRMILTGHRAPVPSAAGDALRRVAARLLGAASAALARRARAVARPLHARQRRASQHDVTIEFHAEAGAPEGALYVDGRFVGYIDTPRL